MPDPWNRWDEELKRGEQPTRLAQVLSDTEILVLLSVDKGGRRDMEKRILRDECLARLTRAQSRRATMEDHAHGEPAEGATYPPASRTLPSFDDYRETF